MSATYMMSKAEREAKRAERTIHATYEGRCQFCGQWTTATQVAHTTFEKLASGDGICRGKPKGRRRVVVSITRNGFNPSLYPLSAGEREQYADEVADATAQAKKGGRAIVRVAL